jgi:transposase-like protein
MNRKLLGAAAFSLALAGGGAAGAILGTPNLSLAQDSGTETTEAAPDDAAAKPRGPGQQLSGAAEAIGITEDELRTALEGGQSIAQVAEANGVDVQTVIDAMVAEGTERLETAIDDLPARVAEAVQREGLPDRGPGGHGGPGHGRGHGRGHFGAGLDAAAAAIGVESEDLRAALQDGSTIAEVAEANGVEVQTVIDALVAEAETHLDEAVADGKLTEDQAAETKANLPDRITAMVNGEGPIGGPGRRDGPPPAADADADVEGTSTSA